MIKKQIRSAIRGIILYEFIIGILVKEIYTPLLILKKVIQKSNFMTRIRSGKLL